MPSSKFGEITSTTLAPELPVERFECPERHWWSRHRGYCPICYDRTGKDVSLLEIIVKPVEKSSNRVLASDKTVIEGQKTQEGC